LEVFNNRLNAAFTLTPLVEWKNQIKKLDFTISTRGLESWEASIEKATQQLEKMRKAIQAAIETAQELPGKRLAEALTAGLVGPETIAPELESTVPVPISAFLFAETSEEIERLKKQLIDMGTTYDELVRKTAIAATADWDNRIRELGITIKTAALEPWQKELVIATESYEKLRAALDVELNIQESIGKPEVIEDIKKEIDDLTNSYKKLKLAILQSDVAGVFADIKAIKFEAQIAGLGDIQKNIAEVDRQFVMWSADMLKLKPDSIEDGVQSTVDWTIAFTEAERAFDKLKRAVSSTQLVSEWREDIKAARQELSEFGLTSDEANIQRATQKYINSRNLLLQQLEKVAEGTTEALEIEAELAKLDKTYELKVDTTRFLASMKEIKDLARGVGEDILRGLFDAGQDMESWSKRWAKITTAIFKRAFHKLLDDVLNQAERVIGEIAKALGAGAKGGGKAGAEAGMASASAIAGYASSVLSMAALVVTSLQGKKDTTVEDFDNAITSTEAFRGVVAGPTNVALSEVGNQLKFALQTTEILLTRIALAVEGQGIAGNTGSITLSAASPDSLSGSTIY
jgi:hypothetical protein